MSLILLLLQPFFDVFKTRRLECHKDGGPPTPKVFADPPGPVTTSSMDLKDFISQMGKSDASSPARRQRSPQ